MLEHLYSRVNADPLRRLRGQDYETIVDVGCGDGRLAPNLANLCNQLYGIELDRSRLTAYPDLPNASVINGDATDLPIVTDSADLTISFTVYEHIPEESTQEYLRELKRVTKPGGKIYIVNDAFFYRVLRRLRLLYPLRGPDPTHINMVTPNQLASEIKASGMTVKEVWSAPFHNFTTKNYHALSLFATKGHVLCTP